MTADIPLPDILRRGVEPTSPETVRFAFARGEIPLNPRDRLGTLAWLLADPAERVQAAARKTLAELPGDYLLNALGDSTLPEPVLDLVAVHHAHIPEVVRRALAHPNVGPVTLSRFTGSEDSRILSLIAENQRALGRMPVVALRLLENPRLEPGVRGRLHSLYAAPPAEAAPRPAPEPSPEETPEFDTVELPDGGEAEAFPEAPEVPAGPEAEALDAVSEEELRRAVPELFEEGTEVKAESGNLYQLVQSMSVAEKIKLAMLGSKNARRLLCRDTNRMVVNAVIRSPKIQEEEVQAMSQDRTMPDDVLLYIQTRKDWVKSYNIRHALVQNPKLPIPRALRLLETLTEKDLRALSKSRNVPSAVSTAALRIVTRRSQKK